MIGTMQAMYRVVHCTGLKHVRTKVSMSSIKALREQTGAPIKAVKEALEANEGDSEQAIDYLRKLGTALAAKRAHRQADDGLVAVVVSADRRTGGIVELSSETDFVARTPQFASVAQALARSALHIGQELASDSDKREKGISQTLSNEDVLTLDSGEERVTDAATALGEKIVLRRAASVTIPSAVEGHIYGYVHRVVTKECGKIGVLVAVTGNVNANDVGTRLAMHVAAAAPKYISMSSVPEEDVEKERSILLEAARTESATSGKPKPENVLHNITTGRLRKWYADVVLEEQEMLVEENNFDGKPRPVQKAISAVAPASKIVDFIRFEVGSS